MYSSWVVIGGSGLVVFLSILSVVVNYLDKHEARFHDVSGHPTIAMIPVSIGSAFLLFSYGEGFVSDYRLYNISMVFVGASLAIHGVDYLVQRLRARRGVQTGGPQR